MVILGTKEWARETFEGCELGDKRRTERLIKLAEQAAARPDGSTPDQTESWADCKAAYQVFLGPNSRTPDLDGSEMGPGRHFSGGAERV